MKKSRAVIILLVVFLALAGISYIDIMGVDGAGTGSASDIKLGLDLAGGVSITYQAVGDEAPGATDMSDTISKLQKRVANYSTEAVVYQEGTDRICIEIPGVSDANAILEELGKPGSLYLIAQTDSEGNDNYSLTYDASGNYFYVLNKSIADLMEEGSVVLEGTDIKSAQAGTQTDSTYGTTQYVVELTMTDEGSEKFAQATKKAYDNGESIAIYYDDDFVSVPTVSAVINDGTAIITGMDSYADAENLASTIRIGGLKVELEELQSKVVGAQLGMEAISTSLMAGAIGLCLVIIILIVFFYAAGLCAAIALCLYIAMLIGLITAFDMTLTLPGIAGIILSIGMAVDANVIIFARIREEIASGLTVRSAIRQGYDKALPSILDGNITTLIVAVILLFLAPASVRGFAQTLAIGIVLSMFTALVITRYLMQAFFALGVKDKKWYGVAKKRRTIDFIGKRKIFFGISGALIAIGVVVMVVFGVRTGDPLNFGLEFKGGTSTTVNFSRSYTLEEVNDEILPLVEDITGSSVQIQTVQDSSEVIFKTGTLDADTRSALADMFETNFGVKESSITTETISSTISSEMTRDTIIAVIVGIICMLIYIRVRFRDIRFGISSVIALCHDVLIVIAFYAVARISVGNTFIACLLTIVGYSINSTIVVFDRVRENRRLVSSSEDIKEVVNRSITQTLSRSLFTSLTTFVMVFMLFILGVTSIREFALPLMAGIICGAYSSICLAGALWYELHKLFPVRNEHPALESSGKESVKAPGKGGSSKKSAKKH